MLTPQKKKDLKDGVDAHLQQLTDGFQETIDNNNRIIEDLNKSIPELVSANLTGVDAVGSPYEKVITAVRLHQEVNDEIGRLKNSPYFARLDVVFKESGRKETIYIGKHSLSKESIYSWASPISKLRFEDVGDTAFTKPSGDLNHVLVNRKDSYMINNSEVLFMTYHDLETPRQVVFQKHFDNRREYMLPEIVAELDKLQDEIIRSDPHGAFLISGPAGSGKTTLALHRVAYLVVTPDFEEYFDPKQIVVFVADNGAKEYFGNLLPELGIEGVRITTFEDWAAMIINNRFRDIQNDYFSPLNTQEAINFIRENNPVGLHPKEVLEEYRKIKLDMCRPIQIKEGRSNVVYSALHKHYKQLDWVSPELAKGFTKYLKFQKEEQYLDEIDLTILLMSLSNPIAPFVHIVIDEVQNWFPEQINVIKSLTTNLYKSITYIGDIKQKTKPFTINTWDEIGVDWRESGTKVELLKVYRNTKQIVQYLKDRGYDVEVGEEMRSGDDVQIIHTDDKRSEVLRILDSITTKYGDVQVGILAKYQDSLNGLEDLGEGPETTHVLTIEESQGKEFFAVIILDVDRLFGTYSASTSAEEFAAQDKDLFYVAATRARERLFIIN